MALLHSKNLYHDEMRSRQRVADVSEINDLPQMKMLRTQLQILTWRSHTPRSSPFGRTIQRSLSASRIRGTIFSQIAAIFGKTESWARVTYHRAKLKIQERMDEKHE